MSTKPYKQNQGQAQGRYLNAGLDRAIFTIRDGKVIRIQCPDGTILQVDDLGQFPLYSMSGIRYTSKFGVLSPLSSEINLVLTDSSMSSDIEEEDIEEENHSSQKNIPKEQKKLLKVDPSKTIAYRQDGFDFKRFFRK